MIRRPPRSTQSRSSAASDVYKRQAGTLGEVRVARHMVRVEMRLDDVGDLHVAPGGRFQVAPDIALGVDHRGDALRLATDQVGSTAQTLSLIHISEPTR